MQHLAKTWWETHGRTFQELSNIPIDILYGPAVPNEDELQLIGPVDGKRVLEIGCGGAQVSIAFAQRGAQVTGVDIAASELAFARELAARHGVTIELLQRDMTDLSPIASASQDVVFSAYAFQYVVDLGACFREVYRVLAPGGLFVFGHPHPVWEMIDPESLAITRSYFDTGVSVEGADTACPFMQVDHTISDIFTLLLDAGFLVERMLEPPARREPWYPALDAPASALEKVPTTVIFTARTPE